MSVVPGPCPPGGCPPFTEIDCIHVDKVYDYCFEADTIQPQICVPIVCSGTVVSATCSVSTVDCTWLMNTPSATAGYAVSTFLITGTVDFTLTCSGSTNTASYPFSLTKSILLCAPDGTTQSCEVLSAICTPPIAIPNGDSLYNLCTTVGVCSTFQSEANVKIMVPSYGFCAPAPCEVSPLILPCPPTSLFPPQCT
jgi:hypothetical protein